MTVATIRKSTKKKPKRVAEGFSLDSETTGVDLNYSARPFIFTLCDEDHNNTLYEWPVNPYTRKPKYNRVEIEEIAHRILTADYIALQNAKFDVTAFSKIAPKGFQWPWHKTHDTYLSGHLLASNHRHDLDSMCVEYLGISIDGFEKELNTVVNACRRLVRRKGSPLSEFLIARDGLPGFPSIKGQAVWKNDLWLPRAVSDFFEANPDVQAPFDIPPLEWGELTARYANGDSAATLALWHEHARLLKERGLEELYEVRRQLLPIVFEMETNGVPISKARLAELYKEYTTESKAQGRVCVNIAKMYDYQLELPKGASPNGSLRTFAFDVMKLPPVKVSGKTDLPSLDKTVIEQYSTMFPLRSREHHFIESLRNKRKRDTAISYQESYYRFMKPIDDHSDLALLHPNVNIAGTDTLRFTSNNPNEQQVSKQGRFQGDKFSNRYCFGPEPGHEWWSLDAQNIELRLPAYESKEAVLIDLFENPEDPPYYGSTHLLNFHTVYPDLWNKELAKVGIEKVGPHCKSKYADTWYQWCKNGGFAIQYGAIEASGTADRAFHMPGAQAKLMKRFSALTTLNNYWIDFATEHGYVETMPDVTVNPDRGYPLLCRRDFRGGIKPTIPLNYHVQGTAMWWMCKAMIRCYKYLLSLRPKVKAGIVMQVHDELVFSFPVGVGAAHIPKLRSLMERGGDDIGVPTPVGVQYHPNNWHTAQPYAPAA